MSRSRFAQVGDARRPAGACVPRLLADMSLADAARSAGLTARHVSAVERGVEPLTPSDARDLGAVLGCPPAWLTSGWSDTST